MYGLKSLTSMSAIERDPKPCKSYTILDILMTLTIQTTVIYSKYLVVQYQHF